MYFTFFFFVQPTHICRRQSIFFFYYIFGELSATLFIHSPHNNGVGDDYSTVASSNTVENFNRWSIIVLIRTLSSDFNRERVDKGRGGLTGRARGTSIETLDIPLFEWALWVFYERLWALVWLDFDTISCHFAS